MASIWSEGNPGKKELLTQDEEFSQSSISTVDSILLYKVYERIAGSGRDTDILQATRDGTVFAAPLR